MPLDVRDVFLELRDSRLGSVGPVALLAPRPGRSLDRPPQILDNAIRAAVASEDSLDVGLELVANSGFCTDADKFDTTIDMVSIAEDDAIAHIAKEQ